ncbi:cytochrome P450 [Pseudonocardia sp. GCM10023141]|uniref:cytochrome P450 n=1 Tax=Pseudonocardia sp. GCM10023141 TaxID=3252653 RepID=UPI0036117CE2
MTAEAMSIPLVGTPLDPPAEFDAIRETCPAHPLRFADGHQGWLVTRHEPAREILHDPRFSLHPRRLPVGPAEPAGFTIDAVAEQARAEAHFLILDPPVHTRIRRSAMSRFSIRAVKGYREGVEQIVDDRLDAMAAAGSPVDLTEVYATPIAMRTQCLVLGVPPAHVPTFMDLFTSFHPNQARFDFLREVLAEKRASPGDDALSDLLRSSELSDTEVQGITFALLASGHDSVTSVIALGAVALLAHPEQLAAFRAGSSPPAGAVEEILRFATLFASVLPRTATEDVDLAGVHVRKGETVAVSPMAANRDRRRFAEPDRFDITRTDALGHLAFGHGVHACLGQQLARLEIATALSRLFARFPTLRLVRPPEEIAQPLFSDLPTYTAGAVDVAWDA